MEVVAREEVGLDEVVVSLAAGWDDEDVDICSCAAIALGSVYVSLPSLRVLEYSFISLGLVSHRFAMSYRIVAVRLT